MDEGFCLCLFFFPSCVMKSALPLNSFHSDECFIINYCLTTMKDWCVSIVRHRKKVM